MLEITCLYSWKVRHQLLAEAQELLHYSQLNNQLTSGKLSVDVSVAVSTTTVLIKNASLTF